MDLFKKSLFGYKEKSLYLTHHSTVWQLKETLDRRI